MATSADSQSIRDVLARDGVWVSTTHGTSMWPMLRDARDTVVVRPAAGRLQKLDVALYQRGDAYVLHRVIAATQDGYRILGDNCIAVEEVPESAILGRLEEFWRGEQHCDPHSASWLAYARVWLALWPLRRLAMRARAAAGRVKRAVTSQ